MSALEALQATTVLLSDEPHESVDTIFFHARAWGDDRGLFPLVANLYHIGKVRNVAINGGNGGPPGSTVVGENWPGCSRYITWLKSLDVARIEPTRQALHTKEENEAFLDLAIQKQWHSGIIVAKPHQILRAFLGIVASMRDHAYWIRVYAVAPRNIDWKQLVFSPHSTAMKPQFERIKDELDRIPIYQAKGHLCSYNDLFSYLERRSTI